MLSILIPVYNYNVSSLVNKIHEQAASANIKFEILCLDDCSSSNSISKNQTVNNLNNVTYHLSKKNNGIATTRLCLAKKATYKWLLFIDADVELKNNNYIANYLDSINFGYKVVFGGIAYKPIHPKNHQLLRWKYGKRYEELSAEKRNKNPYKITSAANLFVKKDIFLGLSLDSMNNLYGMDIFFGSQLKLNNIKVLHVNNNVYHLGLESSNTYLKKTELAVKTVLNLYYQNKMIKHENDLLFVFFRLKFFFLNYPLALTFKVFKNTFKKNLLSLTPVIILLQFYKICYICYLDLTNNYTD